MKAYAHIILATLAALLPASAADRPMVRPEYIRPHPTVIGLPVHALLNEEVKDLIGRHNLVEGEGIIWSYSFPWTAYTPEKTPVDVPSGTAFRFEKQAASGWIMELRGGNRYYIPCPPNIPLDSPFSILKFAPIELKGWPKQIVVNRIGSPIKMEKTETGEAWLYTKTVTRQRKVIDTIVSETTGTLGYDTLRLTTTTQIPGVESITYNPYSFLVHFDKSGLVTNVEDLATEPATTMRR